MDNSTEVLPIHWRKAVKETEFDILTLRDGTVLIRDSDKDHPVFSSEEDVVMGVL